MTDESEITMTLSFEGDLNLAGIPSQMLVDEIIRRMDRNITTDVSDLTFVPVRKPGEAPEIGIIFFEHPFTIDMQRMDDGEAMICVIRKGIHPRINGEPPAKEEE